MKRNSRKRPFLMIILGLAISVALMTSPVASAPLISIQGPVTAKIKASKVGSFDMTLTVRGIGNYGNEKTDALHIAVFLTKETFSDGDVIRGYPAGQSSIGKLNPGQLRPRSVFKGTLGWPNKTGRYHILVAVLNLKKQTYYTATTLSDNIVIRPDQHHGQTLKPVRIRPCQ